MTRLTGIIAALMLATAPAAAQDAPKASTPTAAVAPAVPTAVQQDLNALQVQIAGLVHAQQVLQKELDATSTQFQRTVQQAQAVCAAVPGYELSPSTLTCVKKPEPKKDEPKKESPPK